MSKTKKEQKKSILLIEDEIGITTPLKALLEEMGFYIEVITRINTKLLKMISENKPDLIFLDILLSGKDGRLFCRTLKDNKETKKIPIVIMSAYPNAKPSALNAGADEFIEKPFNIHDILDCVKRYI